MTKAQKKTLYGLLHELIALRDKDRCLKCGKKEWQMSHIYPKGRYKRMELEPDNIKPLCAACHLFWWHRNPIEAHEWLQIAIPKERLARLKLQANTSFKAPFDFKLQRIFLESEIKRLKKEAGYLHQ